MTPEQFYAQYLPYAQSVSQRTGLDPRLVLAQSALETGYGKSAPGMNFFGIKSHGRKGGNTLSTQEFEGGRMVQQPAFFRGYETPEQSFMDYADFIASNPRYKGVLAADGLEAQISEMAKSGYATDPNYGSKLASIASRFDPNSPKVIAAETMSLLGKGPQTLTKGPQMMQEQKPQGLLGFLGIQKMEEGAEGETGQRFYNRDSFKDTAAVLAQGFGRMGIMGMEEIADDIAKQRTENKARNKTAEYLRKAGRGDLADMVDQGMIGGAEAAGVLLQKPKDDRTAAMQNYAEYQRIFAEQGQEAADQFMAMTRKGSVTNINTGDVGDGNYLYGTKAGLPTGFRLNIQTGEASAIPGGPADTAADDAAAADVGLGTKATAGSTVLGDITEMKRRVQESPTLTTGFIGGILKNYGGTGALDVDELGKTIRANIGFDRLQRMREESPTGGALGQVAVQELEALQASLGSLNTSQGAAQLIRNLERLEEQYRKSMQRILNTEGGAKYFTQGEVDLILNPQQGSTQTTKTGVSYKVIGDSN